MSFTCRKLKRTGHWHFQLGLGPFFLTFIPHLRPRLMVYWNKRNLIGES